MTIEDLAKEFILDCKVRNLAPRTIRNYEKQLSYFMRYLKEGQRIKELEELKPVHIKQFIAMLQEKKKKPSYINNLLKAIKVICRYAYEEGYCPELITKKVKDCSRGNTYHNKNFKATAEACDLVVEHHKTYGWSITSASDALLEFCIENGLTEIRLNRNDIVSIAVGGSGTHAGTFTGTATRKPSSTRKYICPCCGMSVRATRSVNIACMDCDTQLVIAA